ncbi:hypothetical protein RMSM_01403 [Rhodopirellula maiorica SM1]|uniref:Uncharacterized protein n=1 Tax=Rhodopirellula maiorica SM1 TaxID=1265738 RepID=M5S210_9BACT|nr:hypothetical protein RMSM_01403 [Rhodopirellula maiorica SM1]
MQLPSRSDVSVICMASLMQPPPTLRTSDILVLGSTSWLKAAETSLEVGGFIA